MSNLGYYFHFQRHNNHMLTGEIRTQIDRIWDTFWSGGISNPLEVIEQITYLPFLKRLDEQETAEELKANQTKKSMQKRFFPEGKDGKKRQFQDCRWQNFKRSRAPRHVRAHHSEVANFIRSTNGSTLPFDRGCRAPWVTDSRSSSVPPVT